jgi:hypothetical protein
VACDSRAFPFHRFHPLSTHFIVHVHPTLNLIASTATAMEPTCFELKVPFVPAGRRIAGRPIGNTGTREFYQIRAVA